MPSNCGTRVLRHEVIHRLVDDELRLVRAQTPSDQELGREPVHEAISPRHQPRRDRFVHRLPLELLVARRLSADQAELVVDEAMDYLVTQYTVPIYNPAELQRAFWAAPRSARNACTTAGLKPSEPPGAPGAASRRGGQRPQEGLLAGLRERPRIDHESTHNDHETAYSAALSRLTKYAICSVFVLNGLGRAES